MALLWKKQVKDRFYEVRTAGNTLRLYTNGVFHTQFNQQRPLTGHVWDLLMLPAFFYPPQTIKRVLVLGVGGGAVIHLLRHFVKPEKIVGIELDRTHVYIAKRIFGLQGRDIELYQADAVSWISDYKGPKFDLIIDDLFKEEDGEPVPVVKANSVWFKKLLRHLSSEGVLVRNFIDREELNRSAGLSLPSISRSFHSVFRLSSSFDENFVAAYLRKKTRSAELRNRLVATDGLNPNLKTSRLRYSIRQLK